MSILDPRIQHAGDAVLVAVLLGPSHAIGILGIRVFRHARFDHLHGIFVDHARRLSALVAHEDAVWRDWVSLEVTPATSQAFEFSTAL